MALKLLRCISHLIVDINNSDVLYPQYQLKLGDTPLKLDETHFTHSVLLSALKLIFAILLNVANLILRKN